MSLNARVRDESGSALVELALIFTVLVLVIVGAIDLGRVFTTSTALVNASRAGAQYGAANPGHSTQTATMVTTAVGSVNLSGVTAVASRTCQCATDAGVLSATRPVANDCTTSPTTTCPTGHRVITVTVSASRTFRMVIGRPPGIPDAQTVTRTTSLRVTE